MPGTGQYWTPESPELVDAVHHSFGAARVPDSNNKSGMPVALHGCCRRLDGNAFTNGAPQGRVVVAEQNWVDGQSDTSTEITGTETDNGEE